MVVNGLTLNNLLEITKLCLPKRNDSLTLLTVFVSVQMSKHFIKMNWRTGYVNGSFTFNFLRKTAVSLIFYYFIIILLWGDT